MITAQSTRFRSVPVFAPYLREGEAKRVQPGGVWRCKECNEPWWDEEAAKDCCAPENEGAEIEPRTMSERAKIRAARVFELLHPRVRWINGVCWLRQNDALRTPKYVRRLDARRDV